MNVQQRRREIIETLTFMYPDADCALNHSSPFELLVATILSAQSTDERVNIVTGKMFKKYSTPEDYAALTPEQLQEHIKEIGLFRSKAKHIVETSQIIISEHGGEVPKEREALESLPGVGRKTANVVMSVAFDVPAIAVDTHVFRVAARLGLVYRAKTPLDTEKQLMKNIPEQLWSPTHHRLIHHGRELCHARSPKCGPCPLLEWCPYGKKQQS